VNRPLLVVPARLIATLLGIALLLALPLVRAAGDTTPNVVRATLDNGLRVVIVRNPLAPVVTTEMNYLVGSKEARAGFPGTAHAEEHMMFRGSPGLSADQLAEITAAMGGRFDADTQQTVTQYYFTVPKDDLPVALHVEATRMRGIDDSQAQWVQERAAIDQEVAQDLSNPEYVFYTTLLKTFFAGTPYGDDALGTKASFAQTTGAMLKDFHDTWYAPNNAILVIVGDVQPDQTLAVVKNLFGSIPAKALPARPSVNLQRVRPATLHLNTDAPYGLAVVAYRLPGYQSADYPVSVVLADVLNNQRGALYGLVPQGKALDAGFEVTHLPETGLGYAVAAFPADEHGQKLVNEVQALLRRDVAHGFSPELVDAAKHHAIAQVEFEKNSVSGLATAWSQALAVEHRSSPEDDARAIARVTPADVDRVARTYLQPDQSVVAILAPEVSGQAVSSRGFGGKESFSPRHVHRVSLPAWAQGATARLSVPPSHVHPTVTTLKNGLRLIVQPETASDSVSVYGEVRHQSDLETPPGKEGVNDVLEQLFDFGTTSLDRVAFAKAVDDIGADESAGTSFSVRALSPHFERAVALLAANVLHPALPESAFDIVRRQTAATVAGRLHSPDYLMSRTLQHALFPANDPLRREATPASVSALTLGDVRAYYQRVFRPDLTTIVVIGNITPDRARAEIEKNFGDWRATGPRPPTTLPALPPNQAVTTAVPDRSRVQDKVALAETVGLDRYNPDYYALQLGDHVLGGAFYATRLYRDLREDGGLVYFVDSHFDVGRTRGVYSIDYAADPKNVGRARTIIGHELEAMRTKPVTAAELHQAKGLLLRQIPLSESSIDGIAQGLLYRSVHYLPLDEPSRAAHHYLRLTAEDVRRAFAKWVQPARLAQVSEGPAPQ
jgi:zinc protease